MKIFGSREYYAPSAPYFWTWEHIFLVVLFSLILIFVPFLMRKSSKKTLKIILIIALFVQVVLEFSKFAIVSVVESNIPFATHIPIHMSSWFMYILPFVIWGKGAVKQCAISFICTLQLFGGFINFFLGYSMYNYPAFSFFGFHALFYHFVMSFIALLLIWTGEYKPRKSDLLTTIIPLVISSAVAIAVDYIFGWDYMFFFSGEKTPMAILFSWMPQWLATILIFVGYYLVTIIMYHLVIAGIRIAHLAKSKKSKKPTQIG